MVKVPYARPIFGDEERKIVMNIWNSGRLTSSKYVHKLEVALAKFFDVKHAIAVSSGSMANLIAITALKYMKQFHDGDEIITSPLTFPTTVNPIIQNNLVPVFVDVDDTLNMNVELMDEAIADRTVGIVALHCLGNPLDMNTLMFMAHEYELIVMEDACDGMGSTLDGELIGTFGEAGTFSFYPAHHVSSCGEGGAIITDDSKLNLVMRRLRDWGRACVCQQCKLTIGEQCPERLMQEYDRRFQYLEIGYNGRMSEMEAGVTLVQLSKFNEFHKRRMENIRILDTFVSKQTLLKKVRVLPNAVASWFGYPIVLAEDCPFTVKDIIKYLEDHGIETRRLLAGNITKHPAYRNVKYRVYGTLDNANYFMTHGFFVGCHHGLSKEEVEYVVSVLKMYLESV